jgi:hypothetical protein
MKKRLRKKLYLGEFAVMGFEFSTSLSNFSDDQIDGFFDALVEFIDSRDLQIGGGGSKDKFGGYISSNSRYGSTTDEDRSALEAWLGNQSGISAVSVQPLSDVNHGA